MNVRHCIKVDDFSKEEILDLFALASDLKSKYRNKEEFKPFANHSMAMIFAKPSARTRVSFETGFAWMGGHAIYLAPQDIGLGKRESAADLAQLFSRYNDLIMARVFSHQDILDFEEHATVPVINGLTDYNHPCQILTDIFTVWEEKKDSFDNLKIVYIGDGNNIVNSWVRLASVLPFEFVCVCPEGYSSDADTIKLANDVGISNVSVSHSLDSVHNADVIYTDVWASMGQKEEIDERIKIFSPFQVNSDLVKNAKDNYLFMHCLPAERGREVTDNVIDSDNSIVFEQAENRLHMQNAIMVTLHNKV
ncbi:MAG: ornithine carbamoyltransferase [Candidatus Neomarinimicrobiota bacterium]|nr:MAG: ornithine carbamoyltransferase [Candidatus Neomarinimicrobiota bacterium]|tara:strand:- start:21 stop:941 length:921 start_codon:yes stop_codon:yes gene_type:complete